MKATDSSNIDAVRMEIRRNPELLNAPIDQDGNTLLHLAVMNNQKSLLAMLLRETNIDTTRTNSSGATPIDVCKNIIENEVDVDVRNNARLMLVDIKNTTKQSHILDVDPNKHINKRQFKKETMLADEYTDAKQGALKILQSNDINFNDVHEYIQFCKKATKLASKTEVGYTEDGVYVKSQFNQERFYQEFINKIFNSSENKGPDTALQLLTTFQKGAKDYLRNNDDLSTNLNEKIDALQRTIKLELAALDQFIRRTESTSAKDPKSAKEDIQAYKAKHFAFLFGNEDARRQLDNLNMQIHRSHSAPVNPSAATTTPITRSNTEPGNSSGANDNNAFTSTNARLQSAFMKTPGNPAASNSAPNIPKNETVQQSGNQESKRRTIVVPVRANQQKPATPPPAVPGVEQGNESTTPSTSSTTKETQNETSQANNESNFTSTRNGGP